ncbi:glucosamine 6-phosphate acetyltransferase [Polychytrium aggregatum]|uniref:glucosamine 6-phosphate acetyltransferase n=1 Tax=Polychytrium aggregatum TaxID=110093 RepID=UPI0022FEACBF|nr:glucosamine 6-phosphate acetyltransferase [Polychytrium aggregatum]KAI9199205.1 glucosamine 6-phosphate acetyltransferase [Polychytrium aggregatum]
MASLLLIPKIIMSLYDRTRNRSTSAPVAPADDLAKPVSLPSAPAQPVSDLQFNPDGLISEEVLKGLPENLKIRPLSRSDYDKGFVETLSQLTTVGNLTREVFDERFAKLQKYNEVYFSIAIEDVSIGKVVALGTIFIEDKFIHEAGSVGHIEDIVVNDCARGKNLGRIVIEALKYIGQRRGAYKTLLACSEKNIGFYNKCGMSQKEVVMSVYY